MLQYNEIRTSTFTRHGFRSFFSANKVQIATIPVDVLRGQQFVDVLELARMVYKTSYPKHGDVTLLNCNTHAILSNGTILRAEWNWKTHKVK